ncbi:helix-turn-helix transcriptional regulator [Nocardioides acrostichi]|uniref:helix-turn-helix transcriptional regulator n=1 Tax=Nocardioides acrostichi TaxID=2784339 RepID=UPI002E2A3EC7|nr:LuxR C-terminal-related transcriptional regulator [Nocardioides acrostichi]
MPQPESVIAALGYSRATDRLYHQVLGQSGREMVSIAHALLMTPNELMAQIEPLVIAGLARIEDSRVFVTTPAEATAHLVAESAEAVRATNARLEAVARAIPFLTASNVRPAPGAVTGVEPVDGEISSGGNPVELLTALIRASSGDLLWLRPDQFREPREDAMAEVIAEQVARGRRSRAIYPVRAATEASRTVRMRSAVGEEIRLLPTLPTRLLIIGTTHAILPEPLGYMDEPRSLVRQKGWVEALTAWFELLWSQATPMAEGSTRGTMTDDMRRFLVQELAVGAQDEQIARRLGVSLRTVRRRIAELMRELDAESRFQAGAEAAKRGWL